MNLPEGAMLDSDALTKEAWQWFGGGLGLAFLVTIGVILLLFSHSAYHNDKKEGIDLGFLGLILLLETIFFLVAFSFLVAASTKGFEVKVLVAAVDALVLFGSKLLAPDFLRYLNDEPIGGAKKDPEAT